jgi:hypothetical protein
LDRIKVLLCATVTRNQKSRLSTKSGLLSSCKSWLRADIRSVTNEARASEVTYAAKADVQKTPDWGMFKLVLRRKNRYISDSPITYKVQGLSEIFTYTNAHE